MRRIVPASILSFLGAIGAAHAGCVAQSASTRTHLLELFTSEGCSSCPPADEWLRGIRADAAVEPLEWHVDYWDSLGWPDRYDDPRFTQRQRAVAARSPHGIIYTPEVALDGREWRGWARGNPAQPTARTTVQLSLHVTPGNPLQVDLRTTPLAGAWRAYFVVTEDGLATAVHAGENNGVVLRHDHTVRAFAGPLPLQHAQARLRLPADLKPRNAAVVAFVQDPATGAVAQVVRQSLAACR
jgi:hypothetical protein